MTATAQGEGAATLATAPTITTVTAPTITTATQPAERPRTANRTDRLAAIDLFRGFAILEVVFHHVTSYAMRQIGVNHPAYELIALANRTLHFAVPGFLFMTALVFTRANINRPLDAARFYRGRALKSLVPYLMWTALYAVFVVGTTPATLDSLADPARWWRWITTGKAYYHLYFLVVALQFYAVFPLLLPLFRRRPRFIPTILALAAAQLGIYWLNRLVLHVPSTGTFMPWYALPIGLGMYVGATFDRFPELWRRTRLPAIAIAAIGWAWYLPNAYLALRGVPVNTFHYAVAFWMYSTAISYVLFATSWQLGGRRRKWLAPIAVLGANSLQVYLVHPAVIAYLDNIKDFPNLEVLAGYLTLYVLTLGLPLVFAVLVKGSPLSRILFGR